MLAVLGDTVNDGGEIDENDIVDNDTENHHSSI